MLTWPLFLLAAASMPAAEDRPDHTPLNMLRLAIPVFETQSTSDYWQVVIERQIIIRVPARRTSINNFASPAQASARPNAIIWKEKKGPKCIAMRDIAAMQTSQRDSIDLLTRQNQRLRAKLSRGCQAVDFYAGFYMSGSADGRLCEGRDELHARTGAKCEVDKFRLMVAERRED